MEKENFYFLIGKSIDEAKKEMPEPYFLFLEEKDGQTFYRSFEYNRYRVIAASKNGIIYRIFDIC